MDNVTEYAASIAAGIDELMARDNWRDFVVGLWTDDGIPLTLGTWLDDALDIEYSVGVKGDYRGARVLLTYGGPNVWLDTRNCVVEVYWGSDNARQSVSHDFCDALDDYFSEAWEMK